MDNTLLSRRAGSLKIQRFELICWSRGLLWFLNGHLRTLEEWRRNSYVTHHEKKWRYLFCVYLFLLVFERATSTMIATLAWPWLEARLDWTWYVRLNSWRIWLEAILFCFLLSWRLEDSFFSGRCGDLRKERKQEKARVRKKQKEKGRSERQVELDTCSVAKGLRS